MVAAGLLALACETSLSTTIAWSLRSTEVLRLRTSAAELSALADAGRVAVRDLLAASAGYLEPAEARSDVRRRWHKFQLSFNAFCANLDPSVADGERLSALCSSQPAFFERMIPEIMAFDPPTRLLDRDLVREIFAEREELAAVAAAATTRADALVERLRANYRADRFALVASGAGFAGACLCILLLAGRAVRASWQHQHDAEEARGLLLETIEAIPAGVVLFDRQERLMMFNTAAVRSSPLLGRAGIIGTTYEALARESEQLSAEYGRAAIGNARDWLERFRGRERKMHQPVWGRWFEWSDRLTRSGHTVSLRVDITDLKQRALELDAARAEYEALLDALPEAVYKLDIWTGRYTYLNPAGARLLGLTRGQAIGTALLDLVFDDEDRAAVEAAGHGGSLAPGIASPTARFRIKTGEGIRRLEVRFTTMVGVFGTELVGTMRDLDSSSSIGKPSQEQMDILLIEADAHRRVAIADHLAKARHRVTICSSVAEAREILCFLNSEDGAPNAIVIGEDLLSVDGDRFQEEMADRFPDACWIPLRPDLSLGWLDDWLTKRDRWRWERSNVVRLSTRRGSSFQIGADAPPK